MKVFYDMLKFGLNLLTAPKSPDVDVQRVLRLLHQLLLSFILIDVLVLIASLVLQPFNYQYRAATTLVALLALLSLYWLNKRGKSKVVALALSIIIFGVVVLSIFLTRQNNLVAATGFLLAIFCAGFLVSRRAALFMTVLASLITLDMSLSITGIFGVAVEEQLYAWLIYLGFFGAGVLILHLVLKNIEVTQNELKKRAIILDIIADAVIITNELAQVIEWNTAAEKIYGWTSAEVAGKGLGVFLANQYIDPNMNDAIASKTLLEKGIWQGEVTQRARDGSELRIFSSVTSIRNADGKIEGMVGINRDITKLWQLEEQRLYNKLLESDLKKEQELSGFKDRILLTVSHEFRTPLAVIQSSVDIFRKHRSKLSSEQIDERLNKIQRQVNRLLHLLNDVVELGRGNQQRPAEAEAIALQAFCEEITEEYRLMNPAYPLNIHLGQLPPVFYAERRSLEHILTNLLSNAIKYSPEGSEIVFSAHEKAGNVEFRVDDKGIGIPAEDQVRIFETFHRAKNVGAIEGTGMGLAIVKQNVSNLGGTIELISEEGKGSSFIVKLPIAPLPSVETVLP